MPIEPTWEETTAVEEPKWEDTTDVETKTPGFLGPAFPLQEGEPPAEPQQDTSAAQAMTQWFQPAPPANALQIQPLGDVNAPMPEQKSFLQEAQEPAINYQLQHPANEGVLAAVGREAANLTLGAAEFPTSEVGAAAGMASAFAPTAVTGLFTLQMMKDLGNQVLSTYQNWGSMTPAQKAIAITDIAGTGVFGAIMGKATAKGLRRMGKTEPTIAAAEPILPQAARAAKETKGAEYATEERNVPQDISAERAGDDALRTPAEAGVGGGVRPTTPVSEAQAPSPAPEQRGVLLTPEERAAEQRALDEALGQETEAPKKPLEQLTPKEMLAQATTEQDLMKSMGEHLKAMRAAMKEGKPISAQAARSYEVLPEIIKAPKAYAYDAASDMFVPAKERMKVSKASWKTIAGLDALDIRQKTEGETESIAQERRALTAKLADEMGFKSTPPPKETPTAPSAAEPSQLTPATQGISEATTAEQKAQVPKVVAITTGSHRQVQKLAREFPEAKGGYPVSLYSKTRVWEIPDTPENRAKVERTGFRIHAKETARKNQRYQRVYKEEPAPAVTTPAQVSTEPFLGKTKAEWTSEYYKSLSPENRRAARAQVISALKSEGGTTKVTQESKPPVVIKGIHELLDLREKKKTAPAQTLPSEPPVEPLQAGLGIPGIEKLDRKFNQLRQSLTGVIQRGGERKQMDQTFDATETMANVVARQATNQLRLNGTPAELEAIYPFIESKGDINRLTRFIAQATGKNDKAVAAANYAMQHWNDPHFQALAARAKAISDSQIAQEQAAGINTEYREAYLPHIYDQDLLMGFNRPFVIAGKGTGIGTGFKKGRTFDTIYDAIEAGYPVKTLNAADALEPRIRSGQKLINRVEWSDSFRHVTDPVDGEQVVTSLIRHARAPGKPGWEAPPAGYVRRTIIPGVDVAVHEGYASLFDALTGTSRISGSVPGKLALEAEGALKHGLLLFDTYHVSRILQKELFLTGPTKMGWRKGLTLLEYTDADLAKALHEGFITQEMADFARANRGDAELLMRSGLNVGRIQENLYNSVVRQIPILGRFNKWVFEKMTRGAMLQSGLIELERVQRDFGLTRQQAALKVARDLNVYFGNLGRQGLFKSSTAMDVARLVALAPQWVEGMLRTEVGGVAKAAIDPIKYRRLAVSSLPLSVGTGLAAYFVGTQILNMVTRGHPTWQNPEKGHKFDAWIPDFSGKTAGYFLSPFSVPAEITHDMIRYVRTEPDTVSAVSRILSNKASPLWRASKTLLTGKDWDKQKIIGSWNRIKASAMDMVPIPIGAAPLVMGEKYPGQAQRQITASVGIKTEPAPTGVQQISELKRIWGENNPDPKIRNAFEQAMKSEYPLSDYLPLRRALSVGDMKKAAEEYDLLKTEKGKKNADIVEAIKPFTGGKEVSGVYHERRNKPIGGMIGKDAEAKFLRTLNPAQRKVYQQAIKEREQVWSRFLELMKTR